MAYIPVVDSGAVFVSIQMHNGVFGIYLNLAIVDNTTIVDNYNDLVCGYFPTITSDEMSESEDRLEMNIQAVV